MELPQGARILADARLVGFPAPDSRVRGRLVRVIQPDLLVSGRLICLVGLCLCDTGVVVLFLWLLWRLLALQTFWVCIAQVAHDQSSVLILPRNDWLHQSVLGPLWFSCIEVEQNSDIAPTLVLHLFVGPVTDSLWCNSALVLRPRSKVWACFLWFDQSKSIPCW